MKRKRAASVIAALMMAVLAACAPSSPEPPDTIEMQVFYDGSCTTCDKLSEIRTLISEELAGAEEYPYQLNEYNVFGTAGYEKKNELLTSMGIGEQELQFFSPPIVVVNGDVFFGEDMVRENIREAYLTAGEDYFVYGRPAFDPAAAWSLSSLMKAYRPDPEHSTAFYFYRSVCEECIRVSGEILPAIPNTQLIDGEEVPQDIIKVNVFSGRNAEILAAFFSAYGVPEKMREVPVAFTTDQFFSGYESISQGLAKALENGGGLNFELPK